MKKITGLLFVTLIALFMLTVNGYSEEDSYEENVQNEESGDNGEDNILYSFRGEVEDLSEIDPEFLTDPPKGAQLDRKFLTPPSKIIDEQIFKDRVLQKNKGMDIQQKIIDRINRAKQDK